MKPKQNTLAYPATSTLTAGRHSLTQFRQIRRRIVQDLAPDFKNNEHLLNLVLNEAEALAWQTGIPQLVFPTLAQEKVQNIAKWRARQDMILRRDQLAFAE